MNSDEVFEVYVRNAEGDTYHLPLRQALEEFLDPEKGYRLTLNIEGVRLVLRNSWDKKSHDFLDDMLNERSIECLVTIRNLRIGDTIAAETEERRRYDHDED